MRFLCYLKHFCENPKCQKPLTTYLWKIPNVVSGIDKLIDDSIVSTVGAEGWAELK